MEEMKLKNQKKVVFALFVLAIIVAIISAAKMPAAGDNYSDNLVIFFVALIIGILSNISWHKKEKRLAQLALEQESTSEGGSENPVAALRQLVNELDLLEEKLLTLSNSEVCDYLDEFHSDKIAPIVEGKQKLLSMLGIEKGASLFLTFSFVERMLNRLWSVASDDHREELLLTLEEVKLGREHLDQQLKTIN